MLRSLKAQILGTVDDLGLQNLIYFLIFHILFGSIFILVACSMTYIFGFASQDYYSEQFDDPTPPGHGLFKPRSLSVVMAIFINGWLIGKIKKRVNVPADYDLPLGLSLTTFVIGGSIGYFIFRFFTHYH
jgi:hypothetical protein